MSLTKKEREVVTEIGRIGSLVFALIAEGGDREAIEVDSSEVRHHIHGLQNAVLAQSAAREHPSEFRLLGENTPRRSRDGS